MLSGGKTRLSFLTTFWTSFLLQNLADEIKDLLDQLGEGGKSIHELDRQRR